MNVQKTSLVAACAALLSLPVSQLGAQTLEGKASANGKMMTINELRTCLKQQESLKAQRAEVEKQRAALDAERLEIEKQNEEIKPLRDEVLARNEKIKAFNDKNSDFAKRVAAFNERSEEVRSSGRSGPSFDRQLRELDKEQRELQALDASLKAEGKTLMDGVQSGIDQLNAKADASQKRATLWNTRNKQNEADAAAYEDKRMDWSANCGGRRYREDDEKALRAEMK
ncbi:MAG: hypothetical protein C4K60_21515 [Ideonella sp. MAG2]|nr:MAG: hypothetical protein C4K60_21515 [Ideonella sp. MAG2]